MNYRGLDDIDAVHWRGVRYGGGMKKPNQPLSKVEEDTLLGEVSAIAYNYMEDFGFDEHTAMDLAYQAMEVRLLTDQAELMAKALNVPTSVS